MEVLCLIFLQIFVNLYIYILSVFKDITYSKSHKSKYKLATLFLVFAFFFYFIDFGSANATEYNRLEEGACFEAPCDSAVRTKIKTDKKTIMRTGSCDYYIYFDVDSVYCPNTHLSYRYFTFQRIEFINSDFYCSWGNVKEYVKIAFMTLLRESDYHLHYPAIAPINEDVNIKMPACVVKILNTNGTIKAIEPCDTNACCEVTYRVRRDEGGVHVDNSFYNDSVYCNTGNIGGSCTNTVNLCNSDDGVNVRVPFTGTIGSFPNCAPDGGCPWEAPLNTGQQFEKIVMPSGCTYFVYYSMKRNKDPNCGGLCNDYAFRFHTILTDGNSSCNLTVDQTISMVTKYFLQNAKTIFSRNYGPYIAVHDTVLDTTYYYPPPPYNCFDWNKTVKIYMQECWSRSGANGLFRYVPCDDSCCVQEFAFDVRYGPNTVTAVPLNTMNEIDCTPPCSSVCDQLNIDDLTFPRYKESIEMENEPQKDEINFKIVNNQIEINLNYETNGKIDLIIYDINGKTILQKLDTKLNNQKSVIVDINNLHKSIYLYSILIDGKVMKNGTFIKE